MKYDRFRGVVDRALATRPEEHGFESGIGIKTPGYTTAPGAALVDFIHV